MSSAARPALSAPAARLARRLPREAPDDERSVYEAMVSRVQEAFEEGRDAGRERAAVVAWLRARTAVEADPAMVATLAGIARAVEAGEHLGGPRG